VGSINRPGGVLVQPAPPLRPFPEPALDETARRGLAEPRLDGAGTRRYPLAHEVSQALPDAVLGSEPYPLEALFLYYTNPLFSRTNGADFRRAFERIPFLVSFSPFLDDSTRFADLVLPDHTFLERWQDVPILPSVGYPVLGIRRPVVEPLYDTRSTGDVLLEIARRLGPPIAKAFPWKDYRALMAFRLGGLQALGRGSVTASSESAFVRAAEAAGGWWDEREPFLPWEEVFRTPSGRFEFFATALRARLEALVRPGESPDDLLADLGVAARGDEAYLPHYEPGRMHGDPEIFPLHLVTYKPMTRAEGRGANQPYLQDMGSITLHEQWSTWLEVNPETARALAIADGDEAVLSSPRGSLHVRVRHYPGARPDVVHMPFEQGHRGYGHWASRVGVNPNDILVRDEDRITGQADTFCTRVRLGRV
ncbi:MAG: molybdopterin dinucleotide binding domain-containing protein, partial [Planctomycetota bacterium]